ncbi:MAG: cell division protein ZapA [Proteobacteria bacterium]|nr:cell division protein ZapA [Pseudomonadota bacterium]
MCAAITTMSVRILDREYQVSCPPEEVEALTQSARYLDEQMLNIRETGKIIGLDRIAVMAGLNISHEFLDVRFNREQFESTISSLSNRIDAAIAALQEV